MTEEALILLAQPCPEGPGWLLCSPAVGRFGHAPALGSFLQQGDTLGEMLILASRRPLLLPAEVAGHLAPLDAETGPAPRWRAVAYGTPLFRLLPAVAGEDPSFQPKTDRSTPQGLVVPAPQAGRFYRAPEPGAAPFIEEGDVLSSGRNLGLIEVMKTFSPIKYQAGGHLPAQAVAGAWLVEDGAEVEEGTPLLELKGC